MTNLDLREIRRKRLQQLIDERFNGSQSDFAVAAKKNPTQVNHWLSGHRNPNGDTCRMVEAALKLHPGWLDQTDGDAPINEAAANLLARYEQADAAVKAEVDELTSLPPDEAIKLAAIIKSIRSTYGTKS